MANRSSFLWSRGKREATKSEATRWKHSSGSCYLSSYTAFSFFFFLLIQKPDAHPRRHYETLSAGKFRSDKHGTLTLDIEGGVGGEEHLSRGRVFRDAHEVPSVQLPIHGGELEIAALLETPVAVLQPLVVVPPAVSDAGWVADLAAQHGAAPVQSILGLGLLGELDGGGLDQQNWKSNDRKGKVGELERARC